MFSERVTEQMALIAKISPASQTTEQNLAARVDISPYNRVLIVYMIGAMSSNATLDSDIEQANALSGGTLKNITGKSLTQLTQAGSDSNKQCAIEVRAEEFDINNGFHYLNVEVTPATAAVIFGVLVFGCDPKDKPVPTTLWDEVVD